MRCRAVHTRTSLCCFEDSSYRPRPLTAMISKRFGARVVGQVEATEVYHSAGPTTTVVLIQSTMARVARIRAVDSPTGGRREVDMDTRTSTTVTRAMGVATLPLQEDGCRLRLVPQASEPACHLRPQWLITTVMEVAMVDTMVEVINRAMETAAGTVPRLHLRMVAASIRVEAGLGMEADIKVKDIDSHHRQAAMIIGTEVAAEAAVMVVIEDMIEDTVTIAATAAKVKGEASRGSLAPMQ